MSASKTEDWRVASLENGAGEKSIKSGSVMQVVAESRAVSLNEEKIILALLYFDVFDYPLKAEEIFRFLGTDRTTEADIRTDLSSLKRKRMVFQFNDLFSVQNNEFNVTRRLRGNSLAEKYLPLAHRKAKLIARFPFVRGVLASGSLAKGYMDSNSDLDFFIITEPGRLWIARTLLVMYKRIVLFNSHKHFCVNYFIDGDHLEIEEKNLFTATELATAIPLHGASYFRKLHEKNSWVAAMFPNFIPYRVDHLKESPPGLMKRLMEKVIDVLFSDRVEQYFKKITLRRWTKIYQANYTPADFEVAFKSREYVSKNHPNHYQKKVEDRYMNRVRGFKVKLDSTWNYA